MQAKRTVSASTLIAKGDMFSYVEGSKYITVSNYDDKKKLGYSNRYIPNTAENRSAIIKKMGKPELGNKYRGKKRFLWF